MQFIRSSTFHWAAALAALFAAFVTILFGFIYFKIDDHLIARSDRMFTTQINFFAGLPPDRPASAIEDHLGQGSRGVQFAGVSDAKGNRLAGNVAGLPGGLETGAPAKSVWIARVGSVPSVKAVDVALITVMYWWLDATSTRPGKSPGSSERRSRSACCPRFAFGCWRARG